jgi:cephalosporin-C deacetylase-like acetyl esterase
MPTFHFFVAAVLLMLCLSLLEAAGAPEAPPSPLRNYWTVQGEQMRFVGGDLAIGARLPQGFDSLTIRGQEFFPATPGCPGIVYRKPDGQYVTRFTDVDNIAHDQSQGRKGAVSDGMYLISVITGWTLPRFDIYAGFNDKAAHDLVLFFGEGVRALRLLTPGAPISSSRQGARPGDKVGTLVKGTEVAVVHDSGMVLKVSMASGLSVGVLPAPDGKARLAVSIPCKGMAANTITLLYDVFSRTDALTVFPDFKVDSPTMGVGDSGYKVQSNGYWALYEKGAKLDYILSFGWLGSTAFPGKMVIDARHALGQPHLTVEARPERVSEAGGVTHYRAVAHPQFTQPGVSEVNVFLQDADNVVLMTERFRIMYDWPSYQPTYNAQPDMKSFWEGTLAELAKVPLEPKIEGTLFKDDPEWEFQHVSFTGWQGQRIHACVYIPKKAQRPLPVQISAHPGTQGFGVNHRADGVYGSKIKQDPRFVTIIPLIRGHAPDAKDIPFNQPWWGPLDSRDDYVARSWYCAMVRALDYLATRPDLADMRKVVASGGSQGGALALVTAALDRRVQLCIADCPSNCMHSDAVRPGTYPTFGPTAGQVPPGQTLPDLLKTLSYYDPANLAPRITCQTVVQLNVGDLTVHSMGGLGVFKNLTGLPAEKKWFFPGVNGHFHAGSADGGKKSRELIDQLLARP